tara:strand:+ start:1122 stop:1532 length:411 start_codon:yes stop_codon:yes gene_type:complete
MSSIQITKEKYSDLSRQGFYKNLNEIENTYSMKIAYFAYNLDSCDHEESMVRYAQHDIDSETEYIEKLRNFKSEHLKNNEGFDIEDTEKNIKNASCRRSRAKNNLKKRQALLNKENAWQKIFSQLEETDQEYEKFY